MPHRGTFPSRTGDFPPAANRRSRAARLLLSRRVGALAGGAIVLIILGCMSLSFGGMSIGCRTEPDGTVCQEGKVTLRKGQELDVYYPIPFASPPNLQLSGDVEQCEIVEQKPDHFRIRNPASALDSSPAWQARGLRGVPVATMIVSPSAAPPADVPPPATTPLPPPTPLRTP